MFIQHLADASHTQARTERKPRRNIQYKDVANAVSHQDSLEFLEDVVPKTVPLKKVRATAKATQARLRGDETGEDRPASSHAATPVANGNGAKAAIVNGEGAAFCVPLRVDDRPDDPSQQLELEMRQAAAGGPCDDGDVQMSG
ncbi:DNA polymerase epsilon subunit C [Tolypocladium capitatum]|uniref:DNA polymerase epsilon subunit C n=1 Tax=Tolypocladium capitatum TaxID=45235 RepID=A0A2K3QDE4_9HYPO|nr:DNA polymerase epsilon subunit C [Tolypocladium capitatum]